jgi:hypothetical protein
MRTIIIVHKLLAGHNFVDEMLGLRFSQQWMSSVKYLGCDAV